VSSEPFALVFLSVVVNCTQRVHGG